MKYIKEVVYCCSSLSVFGSERRRITTPAIKMAAITAIKYGDGVATKRRV
jgi:hypothetical protein